MTKKIMICGVDCHPGDENCNNYCNHDTSKPMADRPQDATEQQIISAARMSANKKLVEAERAWHEYACLCDVGPERIRAFEVYETVRTAQRR